MTYEEEKELLAFRAFKESIHDSLKEYIQDSLTVMLPFFDDREPGEFPTEEKARTLTLLMTEIIEWRCEYERQLQYAKPIKI
jgi:hypothetical protein